MIEQYERHKKLVQSSTAYGARKAFGEEHVCKQGGNHLALMPFQQLGHEALRGVLASGFMRFQRSAPSSARSRHCSLKSRRYRHELRQFLARVL